jgi:transglutaminase-like putative cysteine protease
MQLEEVGFGISPITVPTPNTGGEVYGNDQATIDATDKSEGYVLARWTAESGVRLKVLITGPSGVQYTYNLRSDGAYEVFPFSDGNGSYTIGVYRNTSGNKYATVYKTTLNVAMQNAYAAFLHPNQYVHYRTDSRAIRLAAELTAGSGDTLTKVAAIYRYVTENIRYDYDLAANVQSGYLPDIDAVLAKKRGICFDYAAVMTAMLRGLGIPTKLVVGYCNTEYHAWISVHVEGQGWVNSVVYFDGAAWHHMDPTYAASHPEIGDFSARYTYTEKYVY